MDKPAPAPAPVTFDFSVNSLPRASGEEFAEYARRLERLGFSALLVPDGASRSQAVFPALTWAAAATTTLRVGTYVIANDLHHPFHIAHNAATLHLLSGGRFLLGIGAGRPGADAEYDALGLTRDTPGRRIHRLAAAVTIVSRLLRGETVDWDDEDYVMRRARLPEHLTAAGAPPVMVAGMGPRLLATAGSVADMVSLGIRPQDDWDAVDALVRHVREGAAERASPPALNMALNAAGNRLASWFNWLPEDQRMALHRSATPSLLWGSPTQMAKGIHERHARLGITSFTIPEDLVEALAPVVAGLAA